MPRLKNRVPSYRKHKASGQGVVTLNGRDVYLGKYDTAASREAYAREIATWIARGKQHVPPTDGSALSVVELIAAFLYHAKEYYRRPDGTPTSEVKNYRDAMRPLKKLYGRTRAADFDLLALKAVRGEMIKLGWCRKNVNKQVRRIRSVFGWAAENKLVPASVFHELQTLKGLKKGRSKAPESKKVQPVSQRTAAP